MNTAEILMIAGSMVPDRVALSDPDGASTYAEVQSRVNRLAHALAGIGVGKGANVFLGVKPGSRPPVINVKTGDPEMDAAHAKARATLGSFWNSLDARCGAAIREKSGRPSHASRCATISFAGTTGRPSN